jgi:photosystem II stability/assembly factor-like uncharacterized protein
MQRRIRWLAVLAGCCLAGWIALGRSQGTAFRPDDGRPEGPEPESATTGAAEAAHRYMVKRLPPGASGLPVERYRVAAALIRRMPQYSTALDASRESALELERQGWSRQRAAGVVGLPGTDPGAEQSLGAWTFLGPDNIGGRTRALLIHPTKPLTMWAAGVGGGVWKTTTGGLGWTPQTDALPNIAVSALALDPKNPNVLYAGTGEGTFNTDAIRGLGMYKTTDGGTTWSQLAATKVPDFQYVTDIVVSKSDSKRVYVSTRKSDAIYRVNDQGEIVGYYRPGVFRSLDGGATFEQILSLARSADGCADLALIADGTNDRLVVSCSLGFSAGKVLINVRAQSSKAFSIVLQKKGQGRVSLAVAPSNQNIIYALAEELDYHSLLGVYRSTDGGETWTTQVNKDSPIALNRMLLSNSYVKLDTSCDRAPGPLLGQGWYDNVIAVDPKDPDIVWAGGVDLFRSDDGGKNWGLGSFWQAWPSSAHADQHAITFHPAYDGVANQIMYVANDGGVYRTANARASTSKGVAACDPSTGAIAWQARNQGYGVTQFYHGAPMPDGLSYLGGTQDNGTLLGGTARLEPGPTAASWNPILGGDGGYVAVDPVDPRILYYETQFGDLWKSVDGGLDRVPATNGIHDGQIDSDSIFIVAFTMDPSNRNRLWLGGSSIWRTEDGAANWQLANGNSYEGDITALAVAPSNPQRVLVGTNGGTIMRSSNALSSNGSTLWPTADPRYPAYVSDLCFHPTNDAVALATFSTFDDDDRPFYSGHVFKTADGGATWALLDGAGATRIPDVPVHACVFDPGQPDRIWVGTDMGVFVSTDGGAHWATEVTGFPKGTVVERLALNAGSPRRLFAFTHGRGAWSVAVN